MISEVIIDGVKFTRAEHKGDFEAFGLGMVSANY